MSSLLTNRSGQLTHNVAGPTKIYEQQNIFKDENLIYAKCKGQSA